MSWRPVESSAMRMSSILQRRVAVLAVLALLWAALVPGLAHALQARSGSLWVEVCTAQGSSWLQLESAELKADPLAPLQRGADKSKQGSAWGEHCPDCLNPAGVQHWAPGPQGSRLDLPAGRALRPLAFWQAPRLLAVWQSAQARGPPAV